MDLLYIVKQRPIDELPNDKAPCPFCESTNVEQRLGMMTAVSSNNHHWDPCVCYDCKKKFTKEYKDGNARVKPNVWYTSEDGHVLRGMPSCFEDYTYTCAKCDGKVVRSHFRLDGSLIIGGGLTYVHGVPQFTTVYKCETCGYGGPVC